MASAAKPLTLREFADQLRLDGPQFSAHFAEEIHRALDDAEIIEGVAYELDKPGAPVPDLADECRRLVTLETRLKTMLAEWGAIDPADPSPPDPLDVLRMLLG